MKMQAHLILGQNLQHLNCNMFNGLVIETWLYILSYGKKLKHHCINKHLTFLWMNNFILKRMNNFSLSLISSHTCNHPCSVFLNLSSCSWKNIFLSSFLFVKDFWRHIKMLQIRLSNKAATSESGGGAKLPSGETVTVACPDHLVLAELPVAKSLGSASGVTLVKTVGRRSRRHLGERVHFCVQCDFPIAIYGRLVCCYMLYSTTTFSTFSFPFSIFNDGIVHSIGITWWNGIEYIDHSLTGLWLLQIPCEHAFCLDCARSDSICYL